MSEVVSVKVVANTTQAQQQIDSLKKSLQNIATKPIDINNQSLLDANKAAIELQKNLQAATNVNTGKLDLSLFQTQLNKSGQTLQSYASRLGKIGPEGQEAFRQLAQSIVEAEAPMTRMHSSLIKFGQTIKNTITWQISSSMIHGVMGVFSSAVGYAKDLNESLNNIRIVTGKNIDQMAKFAEQANKTAKSLNTTTTKYTDASLIYYQQGLNDQQVKDRTDVTVKMANAAGISAQVASEQLTAIWNNFDDGSQSLEHYGDVLVKLGAETASSSQEISQGMEKFAAVAETVGLSYEYAAAALATVTATTRQSADTVGTAFKTLFARLEGLSLGETLEDGTDLNKYSAALASVGVDIKDVSGQIKDMDAILDELGAKWQTLGKDQKIALAQTVGGMRQYTQLIALMDNWDFFQQNVESAQNSDGALQKQADIYGESWQAASARAKASLEDLYDSLIDDGTIIKFTNGFAKVIDIVAGLTDSFGGLEGILLRIAAIFTAKYSKEIPGILSSLKTNIQSTFFKGATGKNAAEMQGQALTAFQSIAGKDRVSQTQAEGMARIQRMNSSYLQNKDKMSSAERAKYEMEMAQAKMLNASRVRQAQTVNNERTNARDQVAHIAQQQRVTGQVPSSGEPGEGNSQVDAAARLLNEIKTNPNKPKSKPMGHSGDWDSSSIRQWNQYSQKLATPLIQKAEKQGALSNINQHINNGMLDLNSEFQKNASAGQKKNYLEELRKQLKSIEDEFKITKKSINGQELASDFIDGILKGLGDGEDEINQAVQDIKDKLGTEGEGLLKDYTDLVEKNTSETANDYQVATGSSAEEVSIVRTAAETAGFQESNIGLEGSLIDEPDAIHTATMLESIGQISSAAMMATASIQSVESAWTTFTNSDASQIDKFTAALGSLSSVAMTASSSMQAATTVASALGKTLSGATLGWIGLAVAALSVLLGLLEGYSEQQKQIKEQQFNDATQKAKEAKSLAEANKEVVDSYYSQKIAYDELTKSSASQSDILESQAALADAALKVAEAYGIEGAAMLALGSDTQAFDRALNEARAEQLEKDNADYEAAQKAAEGKLLDTSGSSKHVNMYQAENGQASQRLFNRGIFGNDEVKAKSILSNYSSFNEYGSGYQGELLDEDGNFKDIDSLLQAYDDLTAARDEMMSKMTQQEMADSEVYQSVVGEINSLQETVELYRQYGDDIIATSTELKTLTESEFSLDQIKDLKSFGNYRDKLIKQMAGEDMFDANGEVLDDRIDAYNQIVETVDNYLRQLPQVAQAEQGNLSIINQALDEMIAKREKAWPESDSSEETFDRDAYKDTYADLYELFGNAIFDESLGLEKFNLKDLQAAIDQIKKDPETGKIQIPVELEEDLSPELLRILQALQSQADQNAIQIKLSFLEDFDPTNAWKDMEALEEFAKLYNEKFGTELTPEDLMLWTEDQMALAQNEVHDLYAGESYENAHNDLNNAYDKRNEAADKVNTESEKFANSVKELFTGYDDSGNEAQLQIQEGLLENSSLIADWEQIKNDKNATEEEKNQIRTQLEEKGFGFDKNNELSTYTDSEQQVYDLKATGVGEFDFGQASGEDGNLPTLIDEIVALEEQRDSLTEAEQEYADASQAVAEAEKDVLLSEDARLSALEAKAKAEGLAIDDVKRYAAALKDQGKDMGKTGAELLDMALDTLLLSNAIKDLTDNQEDYDEALNKVLDQPQLVTGQDLKNVENYEKSLRRLVGSNKKLSTEQMKAIRQSKNYQKALQGDRKAIVALTAEFLNTAEGAANFKNSLVQLADEGGKDMNALGDSIIEGYSAIQDKLAEGINADEALDMGGAAGAFMSDLQDMVKACGTDVAAINSLMDELNLDYEVEPLYKDVTETALNTEPAQYGTYSLSHWNCVQGSHNDEFIEKTADPVISTEEKTINKLVGYKLINVKAKGGDNNSGGGKKGGGGGGGDKPKIQKKPSIDHRYHTNQQRKSNLESKAKIQEQKTERAFGQNKIDSLKKQIELQKELTENTREYIDEISSYLKGDQNLLEHYKSLAGLDAISFKFDKDGIIANGTEIRGLLNNILSNMEITGEDTTHIENLIQAMDDYESTLEAWNEAMEQLIENLNKIIDLGLEIATTKIELNIELEDLELEYLDYMLSKIEDGAWNAASAIGLMTQKLASYESKMATYVNTFDLILGSRENYITGEQFDWDYLNSLGPESYDKYMKNFFSNSVNLTAEEINKLKESASEMLAAMTEYYAAYQESMDRFTESVDFMNEKMEGQISLFDHYSTVLENTQEILKLTGLDTSPAGEQMLKTIRDLTVGNNKNQIEALKTQLELQKKTLQNLEAEKNTAIDAVRETGKLEGWTEEQITTEVNRVKTAWDETISNQEEAVRDTEENLLDSWKTLFDAIKTNYEDLLEELVSKYEKTMSAGFGDYGVFKDAYERKKELDGEYLDDYEKLYELSKLTRSILTSMDETDNIKGRERLKTLQAEINKLQEEGVKISQYDVDVLQKKYELELARQELEDAKTNGALVRLSRDQEGNWGYIYTTDEDDVAEKEQEYEDKLYEYQKLNAEYMAELEEKVLEVQGDYTEKLQEIMSLNLSDEERQKAINELKQDTEEKLRIIEESYEKVFGNQSGTLGLMEQLYKVSGPDLVDSWKETVLGMMNESDNLNDHFDQLAKNIKELTNEMIKAFEEYRKTMEEAYGAIDPNIKTPEDFMAFLQANSEALKKLSSEAVGETKDLADEMADIFKNALDSLKDFQSKWLNGLSNIFDLEEKFKSIQRFLDYLAINAIEDLIDKKQARLEELRNKLTDRNISESDAKMIEAEISLITMELKQLPEKIADYYSSKTESIIGNGEGFASGGYTGKWGPGGKLAWLHQKEIVLNASDTENLLDAIGIVRALELNVDTFTNRLAEIMPTITTMQREAFQQEIYITAEFPDATSAIEIQEAFENLFNDAVQYAHQR